MCAGEPRTSLFEMNAEGIGRVTGKALAAALGCLMILCGASCEMETKSIANGSDLASLASAIKLDGNGNKQACSGPSDIACSAQGPGQALRCDPDGWCRFYQSDEFCQYGTEGQKVCSYIPCDDNDVCVGLNPEPDNLVASCIFTESTVASGAPGACLFAWPACTMLAGTPCETDGYLVCPGVNQCECTTDPALYAASPEVCDGIDNDCDGVADEECATTDSSLDFCPQALMRPCGELIEIALPLNGESAIDRYKCLETPFFLKGPDVILAPYALPGTAFTLKIVTSSTNMPFAFVLHGTCGPIPGLPGKQVQPFNGETGCLDVGVSVDGIVGEDVVVIDHLVYPKVKSVWVQFFCEAPM